VPEQAIQDTAIPVRQLAAALGPGPGLAVACRAAAPLAGDEIGDVIAVEIERLAKPEAELPAARAVDPRDAARPGGARIRAQVVAARSRERERDYGAVTIEQQGTFRI
jgi:hypothetical protein